MDRDVGVDIVCHFSCHTMFKHQGETYGIMTTRFNLDTLRENRSFHTHYNKKHPSIGCIYGSPSPIKEIVPLHTKLFVIEMLNISSTKHPDYPGKIVGIGVLRNTQIYRKLPIYNNHNYNRYIYQGKSRIHISTEDLDEMEQSYIRRMEYALFKSHSHQKRSDGITLLPRHILEAFPAFAIFLVEHTIQHPIDSIRQYDRRDDIEPILI